MLAAAASEAEDQGGEDEGQEEDDEEVAGLLEAAGDMEGVAIDLDALLGERERLLRRVADIDRLVDMQRRLGLASDPLALVVIYMNTGEPVDHNSVHTG